MQIDGTYALLYCGVTGPGFAILAIDGGQIRGTDCFGGKYAGVARRAANGNIDLDVQLKVPPGLCLVDGTGPEAFRHIKLTIPESMFGSGVPQMLLAGNNTVINYMLSRIDDRYSPSADGFTVDFPTRR